MSGNNNLFLSLFFVLVFAGALVHGQDIPAGLVTDRPDQTESSISVPHKALQIETGFSSETGTLIPPGYIPAIKERTVSYGSTLLRYGLFKGMELRLAMDYSTVRPFVTTGLEPLIEKGVSPIALGAKIDLTEQKGWIPEIALIIHVNTPVFKSDFSIDYAVPDVILAASHTLSQSFSLGYNLGIEWTDSDASPTKKYSVVAGFGLSDRIGMYVETYGSYNNVEFINMIDGGFTYLILPNLQYDISGGVGVTASSPDFFVSTGISFRLPQ